MPTLSFVFQSRRFGSVIPLFLFTWYEALSWTIVTVIHLLLHIPVLSPLARSRLQQQMGERVVSFKRGWGQKEQYQLCLLYKLKIWVYAQSEWVSVFVSGVYEICEVKKKMFCRLFTFGMLIYILFICACLKVLVWVWMGRGGAQG